MIINVCVKDKVLEVSLGSGQQNFRWLGLVVNARLKSSGILKKSFDEECRTVLAFTNEEGTIMDPTNLICNMVEDKGNVFAEVTESLKSDENGNPILTTWQVSAYVHSDLGVQYYSAMEAYREKKLQEDEVEVVTSSGLLYVGDFSLEDINSAFELDWRQLNWDWLGISDNDFNYHDLKTILSQSYGLVCRIFSHYCGAGDVGDAYGMNLIEFIHFVHTTGTFHWKTHAKKIDDIFASVVTNEGMEESQSESKSSSPDRMTRCDLVYALVKVALRNTKDQSDNFIKAIKAFFTVQLNNAWENEIARYYAHEPDSVLQKTLEQYSPFAKSVFKQFSSRGKGCDVITVADFKQLFVTMATVRQNDDKIINTAFLKPMPTNSEFDELCVCEFIEAVCHLAIAAVPDLDTDTITDVQKIRMLFQSIADFEINGGHL